MDSQTTVVVADENRLFREGLRQVLAGEKEIKRIVLARPAVEAGEPNNTSSI